MGMVAVAVIRQDNLKGIEDAKFGTILSRAIHGRHLGDEIKTVFGYPVDVVLADLDSDEIGIVVVEGNSGYHLEEYLFGDKEKLPQGSQVEPELVKIMQRLGYQVYKRPTT